MVTVANCSAKCVEHSYVPATDCRLVTLQLRYPRLVHADFMTHRDFSRNASGSRAIPVAKTLEQVTRDPAMPVSWGKNQKGMQAREELTGPALELTKELWLDAARTAARFAKSMDECGAHKQIVNRILEPFTFINVIVSATNYDNFDELRIHEDADPTIQALARAMKIARDESQARLLVVDPSVSNGWHLPYVTEEERLRHVDNPLYLAKLSTARCARVSYLTHDNQNPIAAKDLELYERLVGSRPIHASPTEHPAFALDTARRVKNFVGFEQHRVAVEQLMYA